MTRRLQFELVANSLALARALVADPEVWTKGCEARDDLGQEVSSDDARACKFCMVGALNFAVNRRQGTGTTREVAEGIKFLRRAITAIGHEPRTYAVNVAVFNDSSRTTHRQMLAVYDRAVELAEKELAL